MSRFLVALLLLMLPSLADARRMPLDPLNRVHLGLSLADRGNMGIGAGFDSRLTRLVYVDLGAYMSPMSPSGDTPTSDPREVPEDWFSMRHGLYVTPGLRVPHRYKGDITWDVTGRLGFGVVWVEDAAYDNTLYINPAIVGGADLLLRKDKIGLRLSGKAQSFKAYAHTIRDDVHLVRPQFGAEAVYQW